MKTARLIIKNGGRNGEAYHQVRNKRRNVAEKSDVLSGIARAHISWLLACGFSNKAIKKEAHCTDNQIARVVRRTGLKRVDYRNGTSPVAKFVLKNARQKALDYAQPKLLSWEASLQKKQPIRQNGLLRNAA
jgi:hypothetical protein